MKQISFSEFNASKNSGKIVVAFGSPTCKDCVIAQPMLMELSEKYKDINFYGIMVNKGDEVMQELGLRHIPTILFLKDGVEMHQRVVEPKEIKTIEDGIKTLL